MGKETTALSNDLPRWVWIVGFAFLTVGLLWIIIGTINTLSDNREDRHIAIQACMDKGGQFVEGSCYTASEPSNSGGNNGS